MYAQIHKAVCTCRAQDNRRGYGCRRPDSVCEAREGQQTKVHTLAAQDAMIRPVAFTRSYWLRRRHALKNRLLQLSLQTGVPHISPSGIRLRLLSRTQTYTVPVYQPEDLQVVQGIQRSCEMWRNM